MHKHKQEILKILYNHGSFGSNNALYFDIAQQRMQDATSVGLDAFKNYCSELWREWYISEEGQNKIEGGRRSLPLTEKARDYIINYINNPRYFKVEIFIKKHKRLIGIGIFIIVLGVYLVSGCKITDGFSAIDCTKTLIQK